MINAQEAIDLIKILTQIFNVAVKAYPAAAALVTRLQDGQPASIDELRAIVACEDERSAEVASAVAAGRTS